MSQIYRLYIDESGDHSYGKKEFKKLRISSGEKTDESSLPHFPELEKGDKRYLGLTGCVIESENYRLQFHPRLEELKQKHFPYNPDEPLILHRAEIINRRGAFWRLRHSEKEKDFNEDFLTFLKEMNYTVITVVIDKKAHVERYQESAFHPYHYCLGALLERYCGFLRFNNAKGDVLAESRGGSEDKQLKEAYFNIYESGTQFRRPPFFQNVLTSKEIKIKQKQANVAGLQLADLLAHPLKQEILNENGRIQDIKEELFGGKICEIIKEKYNRQYFEGRIEGYGKVFIK
jgi:hypothetical protein